MSCAKKHAFRNELKLDVRSLLEQAAARCQLGQLGNVPTVAQLRKSLTRRAPEKKKCPSGDDPDNYEYAPVHCQRGTQVPIPWNPCWTCLRGGFEG
jgi:hypothetical protein